jgi:putative membrane protein
MKTGGSVSDLNDPRVLFAAERTLLAWNRTSQGLMAFGFVVERSGFLATLAAEPPVDSGATAMIFWTGLAFILLGVFAVIHASRQYLATLRTLKPSEFPAGYATRGGLVLNAFVAIFGCVLAASLYIAHT